MSSVGEGDVATCISPTKFPSFWNIFDTNISFLKLGINHIFRALLLKKKSGVR